MTLSEDLAYLHAEMASVYGESVTYRSGATSVTLTARRASPDASFYGGDVAAVTIESGVVEWRFLVAALGRTPQRGDTITDASSRVWQLATGSRGGQPVWRYIDSRLLGMAVLAIRQS